LFFISDVTADSISQIVNMRGKDPGMPVRRSLELAVIPAQARKIERRLQSVLFQR
jgi:hypothetical protein